MKTEGLTMGNGWMLRGSLWVMDEGWGAHGGWMKAEGLTMWDWCRRLRGSLLQMGTGGCGAQLWVMDED